MKRLFSAFIQALEYSVNASANSAHSNPALVTPVRVWSTILATVLKGEVGHPPTVVPWLSEMRASCNAAKRRRRSQAQHGATSRPEHDPMSLDVGLCLQGVALAGQAVKF